MSRSAPLSDTSRLVTLDLVLQTVPSRVTHVKHTNAVRSHDIYASEVVQARATPPRKARRGGSGRR